MSVELAALLQVRRLTRNLANPFWMPRPASWVWCRPDGVTQGFGTFVLGCPGLANLLWLALDEHVPPTRPFDAATNPLYTEVLLSGLASNLDGAPLIDRASFDTLAQFHARLSNTPPTYGTRLERSYPLLKLYAQRRLANENA